MNKKFTVAVRLNKTIIKGWSLVDPLPGVSEALNSFKKNNYKVIIFGCYGSQAGIEHIASFFKNNKIEYHQMEHKRPYCDVIIDRPNYSGIKHTIPIVGNGQFMDPKTFWEKAHSSVNDHYLKWAGLSDKKQPKMEVSRTHDERLIELLEASVRHSKQTNEYLAKLVDYEMRKNNEIQKIKLLGAISIS